MTNSEKYLKDDVSVEELVKKIADYKPKLETSDNVYAKMQEFFYEPAKPTLTEDARVILRNVKWKGYSATHIGRARENKGSFIYLRFENDIEMTYFFDNFFGHLFQFIKERRRI